MEHKAKQEGQKQQEAIQQVPSLTKCNIVIKGVELSDEQKKTLSNGGYIFLENMTSKERKTKFSAHAFLNDEKNRVFFYKDNSDTFVKYGKYGMRLRDRILIEGGRITKAKVKWLGIGSYAYPCLWKAYNSDTGYQESWSNLRMPKQVQNQEKTKLKAPNVQVKKKEEDVSYLTRFLYFRFVYDVFAKNQYIGV